MCHTIDSLQYITSQSSLKQHYGPEKVGPTKILFSASVMDEKAATVTVETINWFKNRLGKLVIKRWESLQWLSHRLMPPEPPEITLLL